MPGYAVSIYKTALPVAAAMVCAYPNCADLTQSTVIISDRGTEKNLKAGWLLPSMQVMTYTVRQKSVVEESVRELRKPPLIVVVPMASSLALFAASILSAIASLAPGLSKLAGDVSLVMMVCSLLLASIATHRAQNGVA